MPISASQRARLSASLARYIADLENARDVCELELHFHRAGAYIAAVRDVEGICVEQTNGLLVVIDLIYQHGLSRLEGTPILEVPQS